MTVIALRKPGRPHGSVSQKTLLKARADAAMTLLESITKNPNADPLHRIQAASAIVQASYYHDNSAA